jgi:hypothetical protein
MKVLNITNTPIDTAAEGEVLPFVANNNALAVNVSSGSLTVQTSDDGVTWTGATTTQYTCAAGVTQVQIDRRYIRVATAASVDLIQN